MLRRLALTTVLALVAPVVAMAECPPLDGREGFKADGAAESREWDSMTVATATGPMTLAGHTCAQRYSRTREARMASSASIQRYYRGRITALGGDVVLAEDSLTLGRLRRAGGDQWYRISSDGETIDLIVLDEAAHRQRLLPPTADDIAPLGRLPEYRRDTADSRAFDQRPFTVRDGDEVRETLVQGARHEVDYVLREGATPASDRDIHENYRYALRQAGAEILFTDDRNTTARLARDGRIVWFKIWSEETAINIATIEEGPHVPSLHAASGNDYSRLGHMPGYVAEPAERKPLDEVIFPIQIGDDTREVRVQGSRFELVYAPAAGRPTASDLDIQLNYRSALTELGAQILFTDAATTVARFGDKGRLVWVKVWSQETSIALSIVEEKAFKANVRPVSAESLRTALEGRGRAALYLSFQFDRPTLQPGMAPMLAEVIRLLRESPELRLLIENHTDNIGPPERNRALAAARAASVRDALIGLGVAPERLESVGIGPDRPITDNATSEARARNRRTVLVRR